MSRSPPPFGACMTQCLPYDIITQNEFDTRYETTGDANCLLLMCPLHSMRQTCQECATHNNLVCLLAAHPSHQQMCLLLQCLSCLCPAHALRGKAIGQLPSPVQALACQFSLRYQGKNVSQALVLRGSLPRVVAMIVLQHQSLAELRHQNAVKLTATRTALYFHKYTDAPSLFPTPLVLNP